MLLLIAYINSSQPLIRRWGTFSINHAVSYTVVFGQRRGKGLFACKFLRLKILLSTCFCWVIFNSETVRTLPNTFVQIACSNLTNRLLIIWLFVLSLPLWLLIHTLDHHSNIFILFQRSQSRQQIISFILSRPKFSVSFFIVRAAWVWEDCVVWVLVVIDERLT